MDVLEYVTYFFAWCVRLKNIDFFRRFNKQFIKVLTQNICRRKIKKANQLIKDLEKYIKRIQIIVKMYRKGKEPEVSL